MQKTDNYQLNQWDPEDRIQREDFNGDNEKIDAALAATRDANSVEKFFSITTTADAQQVEADVSGIDFTAFQQVDIYFRSKLNGHSTTYFYLNETLEKEYYLIGTGSASSRYSDSNNISTMASWQFDPALTSCVHLDLGMPCAGNGILCRMQQGAVGPTYVNKSEKHYASTSIKWEDLKKLIFLVKDEGIVLSKGTTITVMGVKL